ncbi:2-dehydropantoate 2-reductase [Verticiella sediminum]|uniref:2-dehydropantoate 2-reductase n=1 Tax=Verticiella sediminum TaxID=1247510 RepID=A0A556ANJ6_9BURK|nr:2-dehydropantoate 2-reductase [Verticiella sediminum]TSH94460.1 2-dehydropantoate 2-reductase [Verticiella sediminum]
MKIAVMGAGAVGCYYGAMLARAGHEVALVGRPMHVEAMRRDGLRLESAAWTGAVPVSATTSAAGVAGAEVVLFCVKATDTERTAAQMAPHLAADATVISLQNGVDNVERLAARLGQVVVPGVVYAAVAMAGPGIVRHRGGGELVLGAAPGIECVAQALRAAGVDAAVSSRVAGALWAKLITNCAYNALSAIVQRPYGELVQGENVWAVMRDAVDECIAVAGAAGIELPDGIWAGVEKIAVTMPAQVSSTAQDLARGKPSEIDHLNGYVLRKGAQLGVATPVNRALHALVRLLEQRRHGHAAPG